MGFGETEPTWTVAEARAYLPRLAELVALIDVGVERDAVGALRLRPGAEHAEAALAELEERGVILRQLDHGLVDFPSLDEEGRLRYLCWRVGEPDLEWWHWPDAGFSGRFPL